MRNRILPAALAATGITAGMLFSAAPAGAEVGQGIACAHHTPRHHTEEETGLGRRERPHHLPGEHPREHRWHEGENGTHRAHEPRLGHFAGHRGHGGGGGSHGHHGRCGGAPAEETGLRRDRHHVEHHVEHWFDRDLRRLEHR